MKKCFSSIRLYHAGIESVERPIALRPLTRLICVVLKAGTMEYLVQGYTVGKIYLSGGKNYSLK